MKKLMIAACAVAMTAAVQAASFTWVTDSKFFSVAEATINAGLTDGQHYSAAASGNANTTENQISTFGAVWTYQLAMSLDGVTWQDFSDPADFITDTRYAKTPTANELAYQDPTAARDVYYKLVVTGELTDGLDQKVTLVSDEISGTWNIPKMGEWDTLTTSGTTGWTATVSSVPEPTSGLLLLLGVAGLALRRRRA